ncbi:recombinase family protein [Novosphingobium tardum]|uniref:Recombinase family protein n=1 Tax=Novosphingobium tardum TaxID=1538021 RepID=A0ABV8RJI2_9SPHN
MPDDLTLSLKRCAIYTRKSTNHLLDRDINSLTTQREICGSYIKSQQYRGWVEMPDRYDDGGHSGSGLERPALAQLMQDIEAGQIDAVVVYKIDRLTRSLIDFVRLIEIFDRRGIALVSISQAFDTSDSMGRMILNVLLTFSQFERELIAERVRDSIRTRKRHGKVHGGLPPFGYDSTDDGLRIVPVEAEHVRFIFNEFLRTQRYTATMNAVRDANLCSVVKYSKRGEPRGGTQIGPGTVYQILRNPIYVGEIPGHDQTYAGRHEPIISRETWEAAQVLSESRKKRPPHAKQTNHFLAGLLWDDLGRHMLLDVDWHRGQPYFSYSSSNATWSQSEYRRQYRSHAGRLEELVIAAVSEFLADRLKLRNALKSLGLFGDELDSLAIQGKSAAQNLEGCPAESLAELFAALLLRIEVGQDHLSILFRSIELRRFLLWDGKSGFRARPADWPCSDARYILEVGVSALSASRWPLLHIKPREAATAKPGKALLRLLQNARTAQRLVEEHRDLGIDELAGMLGRRPGHFSRLVRLNYLAPDIVTAILDGTQPETLTKDVLLKANLPTDWSVQRKLLGFEQPERPIAPSQLYGRGLWPQAPNKLRRDRFQPA